MHVQMNLWIEAYSLVYVIRVVNNLNIVWPTVQVSDREISSERVMGGLREGVVS